MKPLRLLDALPRCVHHVIPTEPPKSADDTLIDFLVQCDAQGFHFQFPSTMNRSQINALIEPLHVSDEDRQAPNVMGKVVGAVMPVL